MTRLCILIGTPTCELKADSLQKYFEGINQLTNDNVDVLMEDNSSTPHYAQKLEMMGKEWEKNHPHQTYRVIYSGNTSPKGRQRLVHGRNRIRDICLNEKYDYFFSLEQDIVPPVNGIETLLSRKKDFVSGGYLNKKSMGENKKELNVVAGIYGNETEKQNKIVRQMGFLQLFPSRLMKVAYTGLGCALISRNALETTAFRYEPDKDACDDIYFCMDLQERKIPIYLDSSVLCAHYFNNAFQKTEY